VTLRSSAHTTEGDETIDLIKEMAVANVTWGADECLDHVIVFDEEHLRRVVKKYVSYFNASRPHQGVAQRIPGEGHGDHPINSGGRVAAMPILGGLHHDYRWAA
jgi:hypothetical protein